MKKLLFLLLFCAIPFYGYSDTEYVDGVEHVSTEVQEYSGISAPSVAPIGTSRIYFDSTTLKTNLSNSEGPYYPIATTQDTLIATQDSLLRSGSNADQNIDIGAYSLSATGFDAGSALITNVLDPVSAQDAATKEYVDTSFEGIAFDFFLNDTASNIATYFVMDPAETGEAESSFSDTITNDDFTIDNFATVVGEPTFTELVVGIYSFHLHASTTTGANTDTIRLFFELYKRAAAGGAETLLITSEESSVLTSSKTSYEVHGSLVSDTIIASDDRFVLRVKANIETDRPTSSVTTIFTEGTNATRFEARTTVSAFDDRYVKRDGSNELTANWDVGAYTIQGTQFISDITTGTAPFVVASTTEVTNLKAATATLATSATTALAGDAAVDFFGAGVTAVTDATTCTDIEGSGLSITSSILNLDINELAAATIVAGDFVPFWDITATATNKKTTFTNFEAALTHDNLIAGTIADHDTTATGANLTSMTDNSMVDTLHRHSELSASDGTPDQAVTVDATGNFFTTVNTELGNGSDTTTIKDILLLNGISSDAGISVDGSIWHRTDLDQIRVRLNGKIYELVLRGT